LPEFASFDNKNPEATFPPAISISRQLISLLAFISVLLTLAVVTKFALIIVLGSKIIIFNDVAKIVIYRLDRDLDLRLLDLRDVRLKCLDPLRDPTLEPFLEPVLDDARRIFFFDTVFKSFITSAKSFVCVTISAFIFAFFSAFFSYGRFFLM
jgi:hypothetical protein